MEDWPLSSQELIAAKPLLNQKVSFLDVARRASRRIEPCWHKDFTHKCVCPFHASGMERTPSLYFSEKNKVFHCFGCDAHGDLFDFIGLVEGQPWFVVVQNLLHGSEIDTDQIDVSELENVVSYDTVYELNYGLAIRLRDYLEDLRGKSFYKEEKKWVDATFKKIDERFRNLDDSEEEAAKGFRIQTCIELNRRKARIVRKYENRGNR
jgi:hypothetical protein